ncbi:MAG TPA: c-type cytochrome [Thiobacillaceae bacterium]
MKPFVAVIALALPLAVAPAQASQALAAKSRCLTCHDLAKKKTGPAFQDIAAKYKGQADAEAMLAASTLKGSKGKWGKAPMPAQKVTPEDARALVKWVLSM